MIPDTHCGTVESKLLTELMYNIETVDQITSYKQCLPMCFYSKYCDIVAYKESKCQLLGQPPAELTKKDRKMKFVPDGHAFYSNVSCGELEFKSDHTNRVDLIQGAKCCANELKNHYYKTQKDHLPEAINSLKNCFRSCLARNSPGPQRCFGFMYYKKTKECYLIVDHHTVDCIEDSDDLKVDKDYDFYCNLYCSKNIEAEIPPNKCTPGNTRMFKMMTLGIAGEARQMTKGGKALHACEEADM